MKYYIHNFDGDLIGPEDGPLEGVIPFDVPEMRYLAYEFDSEMEAVEAHEELLSWGNGGVTNDDELNGMEVEE